MSRRRILWLEIAKAQQRGLPAGLREVVDRLVADVAEGRPGPPGTVYDALADHWSTPIGESGLLVYALVPEPGTVIVIRLLHLDP